MKKQKYFFWIIIFTLLFSSCVTNTPVAAPTPLTETTHSPILVPQEITFSNVSQLQEVTNYGKGYIIDLLWGQDDQFYIVTSAGIEAYSDLGETLRYTIHSDNRLYSADLTHDGKRLVGCTDSEVLIWDAINGSLIHSQVIPNSLNSNFNIRISPDDSRIGVSGYQWVLMMNSDLETLFTIDSSKENITATVMDFSPAQNEMYVGFYAIDDSSAFINVYDTLSFEKIRSFDVSTLSDTEGSVLSIDFIDHGDKFMINLEYDDFLYVLDTQTGNKLQSIPKSRKSDIYKLSQSSSILAQVTYDDLTMVTEKVNLYDWKSQNLIVTFSDTEIPYRFVHQLAVSPDDKYIITASVYEDEFRLWDIKTGNLLKRFDGYFGDVSSFDLSPDGSTMVFSQFNSMIYSLNTITGQFIDFYEYSYLEDGKKQYPSIADIFFSPDGQLLTVVTSANVFVLSVDSMSVVFDSRLDLSEKCSWDAVPSSDGSILAMSCLDGVIIIDTNTWQERTDLRISPESIHSHLKDISSDARELVFTIPETMKIGRWDIYNNQLIAEIPFFATDTRGLVFSPDGKWLAMGTTDRICLYYVPEEYKEISCADGGISNSPVFSLDSSLLITGRAFYNVTSGSLAEVQVPAILTRFHPQISQDGKLLVSINSNGTFSVWQVLSPDFVDSTKSNLETIPTNQTVLDNSSSYAVEPTFTATTIATMTVEPTVANAYEIITKISPVDNKVMVYVPEGDFQQGANDYKDNPLVTRHTSAFWIDQTEVTNQEYATFINEKGNLTEGGSLWYGAVGQEKEITNFSGSFLPISGFENYPVDEVTWYGAQAYCKWAGKQLPTQKEWEKAARGIDGRIYAWGNEASCGDANLDDQPKTNPDDELAFDLENCDGNIDKAPVMSYPKDVSPYGVYDMTGNVYEWVQEWTDHKMGEPGVGYHKMVKGGSYSSGWNFNLFYFNEYYPDSRVGFRCVMIE